MSDADERTKQQFSSENMALDAETVRHLDNAATVLADVPTDELTKKELRRLLTINRKLAELRKIVKNREAIEV